MQVYAAIVAHKGLAAFALGSQFAGLPPPGEPLVAGVPINPGRRRGLSCGSVLLMLAFAAMTPAGVGLGWLLVVFVAQAGGQPSGLESDYWAEQLHGEGGSTGSGAAGGGNGGEHVEETAAAGVCQALAAGTFLYVATMDILPAELKADPVLASAEAAGRRRRLLLPKALVAASGAVLFGLLAHWV